MVFYQFFVCVSYRIGVFEFASTKMNRTVRVTFDANE